MSRLNVTDVEVSAYSESFLFYFQLAGPLSYQGLPFALVEGIVEPCLIDGFGILWWAASDVKVILETSCAYVEMMPTYRAFIWLSNGISIFAMR